MRREIKRKKRDEGNGIKWRKRRCRRQEKRGQNMNGRREGGKGKRRTGENTWKNGNVYKAIEKIITEGYVCIVHIEHRK
jgi:hypothetical protein